MNIFDRKINRKSDSIKIRKWMVLIIFVSLVSSYYASFEYDTKVAEAADGDIGIWGDSAGLQIPGTSFAAFNFATEERNDGAYTFTGGNNLNFDEPGNYLLIATVKLDDSSNGRANYEGRFTYTGTGNFVVS